MAVLRSEESHHAEGENEHGDEFACSEVIAEDGDGGQSAGERGNSKERCLSRSPEEAHRFHGEDEAHPVACKAEKERWANVCGDRKPLPEEKSEHEARRPCPKRLRPSECYRVSQREALGEVVVDGPAQARRGNCCDPEAARLAASSCSREKNDAKQNYCRSACLAEAEVLAEDEDGEEDGKGSFEVQHERADESGGAGESGEQEQ